MKTKSIPPVQLNFRDEAYGLLWRPSRFASATWVSFLKPVAIRFKRRSASTGSRIITTGRRG